MHRNTPTESSRNDRGASLVECALLIALIALVALMGTKAMGTAVADQFIQTKKQMAAGDVTHDICDVNNPSFPDC